MYITISILILLASLLLIGVVLIQKSKGGGLAANVSNYNQFAGVKQTTAFVEKATWGLAIFICVLSIASPFISKPTVVSDKISLESLKTNTADQQATQFPTQQAAQSSEQKAPQASNAPAQPAPAQEKK